MSRRGFWFGLLVGIIVMGLLAATAAVVIGRFRWPAAGIGGLRGRQFGVNPRGWFDPRMPGRWLGFGAMLCGPLLLAGALVLGALLGRHWYSRRQGKAVQSGEQAPSLEESVAAEQKPAAEAVQNEARDQTSGSTTG